MSVFHGTNLVRRIGYTIGEARRDHQLSERQLAALAGVSRATIRRLERDGQCRPDLAVKVAAAITVVYLYAAPGEPELDRAPVGRLVPVDESLAKVQL